MHAVRILSQVLENSPLRHPTFRHFYFGSVGTALGYTMQATIAAWLMATLTTSALMVALVQTASTVPTLLFGLAAGALADIFDRRRIIFVVQLVLLAAAMVLGITTVFNAIGPGSLLLLTFVIGTGFTFYMPRNRRASTISWHGRNCRAPWRSVQLRSTLPAPSVRHLRAPLPHGSARAAHSSPARCFFWS